VTSGDVLVVPARAGIFRTRDREAAADPLLVRAAVDRMSSLYVVDHDRRNPLLSPAVTADLTGLPPVLVQVDTNEMLLDDARRLAVCASDAEVAVVLDIIAKVPHVPVIPRRFRRGGRGS